MLGSNPIRTLFAAAAVATVVLSAQGCVADRPSRNGVFNENQYIRKDFLVQPGTGGGDPGWYMKATIVQTSTPNPFANMDMFVGAESAGAMTSGNIVRFAITSDKLQILDMRELSNTADITAQNTRTPAVMNAWPVTNVDLKYRVNLDGETTNFYEENQELDWQVRQWVKVNFDKNDLSDVVAMGPFTASMLNMCSDTVNTSVTLVPNSFLVDESNNYMSWTVAITAPVDIGGTANSAACAQMYGTPYQEFLQMNRSTVTLNVMYSFVRATPVGSTGYVPLVVAEKDPIRHKYGSIQNTVYSTDVNTGLTAANQYVLRYDPNQDITFYLAQGYPADQIAAESANPPTGIWNRPNGIVAQTNAIFAKAGAKGQLKVLNYNDQSTFGDGAGPARVYGDIRYSFIQWESDIDTDSPFIGVTQFQPDPRTGQLISASVHIVPSALHEYLTARVTAYLTKVLATNPFSDPPPDPSDPTKTISSTCTSGQLLPLLSTSVQSQVYANDTLYQKMAQYLSGPTPIAPDGATTPGPTDYVYNHTGPAGANFYQAYYALIPYTTYGDPAMNQFTTPSASDSLSSTGIEALMATIPGETQFQQAMSDLDNAAPDSLAQLNIADGTQGMIDAYNAADNVRQLWQAHRDFVSMWSLPHRVAEADTTDLVSFPGTMARASRQCVNGAWESQAAWQTALEESYQESVIWHEFGHILGLEHNFMGSVDKAHWPTYTAYDGSTQFGRLTSSVMEYDQTADRVSWNDGTPGQTGWLQYDTAAIAWIYGNNLSSAKVGPQPATPAMGQTVGISGQVSATAPWNDPYGFTGTAENQFLTCSEVHLKYTPLCRTFDLGSTPSEITAADIESYEWNYNWRNFRQYFKVWDDSNYATPVSRTIGEMRRFMAMDQWDWNPAELTDKLIQVNIVPPAGAANSGLFYSQLTSQFTSDLYAAENLVAAFHEALIQQSTGQRPFQTQFDPYYGDVTQQGIAIDKELAFINWLGLWAFDNYDPTQANGYSTSSMWYGSGQTNPDQAWSTAGSMLGEKGPWDAYPQFFPTAVALFAHDTQSPVFLIGPYPQMKDWIGGHTFTREVDALAYFQNIAVQNIAGSVNLNVPGTTDLAGCVTGNAATCTYNPMTPAVSTADIGHSNAVTQAFIGPDGRRWSWVYLADRNIWFFVDQDRNSSAYFQVLTYNQDENVNYDDGNNGGQVYNYQANIKYMIDAYGAWGGDTTAQ